MSGVIIYIQQQVEGGFVNEFKNILPAQVYTVVGILLQVVALYLTAWILYKGIRILLGKDNENVKDFAWDAFLKGIFIAFCVNGGGWINLVNDAMEGIRSVAFSGVLNLYDNLQELYDNSTKMTDKLLKDFGIKTLYYILPIIMCWIGFAIGALSLLSTLILNTLSFYLLILVSPLIFFFLIFGFLKGIFTQWYTLLLSNILTLFFLAMFCNVALVFANEMVVSATKLVGKTNCIVLGLDCILAGLIVLVFTNLAKTIAEKLTNVSVEASVGSVARNTMGTAGGLAGAGAKYTGLTAKEIGRSGIGTAKYGMNFANNWNTKSFKEALKNDWSKTLSSNKGLWNKAREIE